MFLLSPFINIEPVHGLKNLLGISSWLGHVLLLITHSNLGMDNSPEQKKIQNKNHSETKLKHYCWKKQDLTISVVLDLTIGVALDGGWELDIIAGIEGGGGDCVRSL